MQQFLQLSKIDIFWFIPFLVLSFIAAVLFFDAYFQIYLRAKDGSRKLFLERIVHGCDLEEVRKMRDPLIRAVASLFPFKNDDDSLPDACSFAAPLQAGQVSAEEGDASCSVRRKIKDSLHSLITTRLPHENFFNYYCGVIMLIAYLGTLISMFFLLSNFNIQVSDFSDLFKFMGVGIKSSLFGVAASAIMSTGIIYLEKLMERRKEIVEDFGKELIRTICANEERNLIR